MSLGHIGNEAQSATAMRALRDVDSEHASPPLRRDAGPPRQRRERVVLIRLPLDGRRPGPIFSLLDCSARLDWSGTDSSHSTSAFSTSNLNDKHNVGNVRFTLRDPANKWRLALFGKNVTDEEVVTQRSNDNGGVWMPPRTLRLEVIYEFM